MPAWQENYERLLRFVEREGHALVPVAHVTDDGIRLGVWVFTQRRNRRIGKLAPEREEALEGVPGWTWNPKRRGGAPDQKLWGARLKRFRQYVKQEGHSQVPARYVTRDGLRLGYWVDAQRRAYRQGELSPQRQDALEAVPGWEWNPLESAWLDAFERLCEFADREGHVRVPFDYVTEDGFRLGVWAEGQRRKYREKRIVPERREALELLSGWRSACRRYQRILAKDKK